MLHSEIAERLDAHRLWKLHKGGARASFRYANLDNNQLNARDLREVDFRGASMRCTNLRGANLRGANIGCADLRGADIEGAKHIVRLDMNDPRGYDPIAVKHQNGWRIYSGCRNYSVEFALEHWGRGYHGKREIAARYRRAIRALPDE